MITAINKYLYNLEILRRIAGQNTCKITWEISLPRLKLIRVTELYIYQVSFRAISIVITMSSRCPVVSLKLRYPFPDGAILSEWQKNSYVQLQIDSFVPVKI